MLDTGRGLHGSESLSRGGIALGQVGFFRCDRLLHDSQDQWMRNAGTGVFILRVERSHLQVHFSPDSVHAANREVFLHH